MGFDAFEKAIASDERCRCVLLRSWKMKLLKKILVQFGNAPSLFVQFGKAFPQHVPVTETKFGTAAMPQPVLHACQPIPQGTQLTAHAIAGHAPTWSPTAALRALRFPQRLPGFFQDKVFLLARPRGQKKIDHAAQFGGCQRMFSHRPQRPHLVATGNRINCRASVGESNPKRRSSLAGAASFSINANRRQTQLL